MKKNKHLKVCFACSSGGHLAQIKQLFPFSDKYITFLVTEQNETTATMNKTIKTFYLKQQERKNIFIFYKLLLNILKSIYILFKEKPNVIISTGAGATLPLMILGKLFGAKIIFIESFAKINTPTITGKITYVFADQFYIQWPDLKKCYPNALYRGKLY
ncbi:polysaccharide biosynthesis protein [Metabacillus indicus]|uniref:Polysaccharide biosynthesis protein n=1 Tax=Metabacillus indicus TaxID=246786 RepID=A0A084GXY4_METID|nr:polysaccharide biosynthesis protein [Metabacillus indicus]